MCVGGGRRKNGHDGLFRLGRLKSQGMPPTNETGGSREDKAEQNSENDNKTVDGNCSTSLDFHFFGGDGCKRTSEKKLASGEEM